MQVFKAIGILAWISKEVRSHKGRDRTRGPGVSRSGEKHAGPGERAARRALHRTKRHLGRSGGAARTEPSGPEHGAGRAALRSHFTSGSGVVTWPCFSLVFRILGRAQVFVGPIAQRLEQWTHNPLVVGSNPTGPTRWRTPRPRAGASWSGRVGIVPALPDGRRPCNLCEDEVVGSLSRLPFPVVSGPRAAAMEWNRSPVALPVMIPCYDARPAPPRTPRPRPVA